MQYGFDNSQLRVTNKKELNQRISDEQIYHHYLGDFTLNEYMISPRGEDEPSFQVDFYDGLLQWRDFGWDPRPGDAINLVQYLEELQGRKIRYHDALQKVHTEVDGNIPYTIDAEKIQKEKKDLRCRYRHRFLRFEAEYWRSQKLKKSTIRRFSVYPGEIWVNNKCWHHSRFGDPLFIYLFNAADAMWKGYRPIAPPNRVRFIEENCTHHVQGWEHLASHKTCIITKSYKDVMTYFELGYIAVAPRSENQFLSPAQVAHLKQEYKHLYINYDPDDAGLRNMTRYSEEFDIPNFHFEEEGVKDLTELRIKSNDAYVKGCLTSMMH